MNMSFSITTPQFLDRTKTVTRRMGWRNAVPGQVITAVEKAQGLRKGARVRVLGTIRVVDVRTETLDRMILQPAYGRSEAVLEGFPELDGRGFVAMFCEANKCLPTRPVRRIQFEYVLVTCRRCGPDRHSIDEGATCARCYLVQP